MLNGLQWLRSIVVVEVEQLRRSDRLSGKSAAGGRNRRNAAPRRLHPPHPDP
jgi:hypothetical protein